MTYEILENGAMLFSWDLPPGTSGQNYQVRIRSKNGSREFVKSSSGTDITQVYVSARDLRALGQAFDFINFFNIF